jgi:probable F420-dependent oxidoreductase
MRFGITPKEVGPFSDAMEEVELGEEVGFDSCWASEHHVQPDSGEQYWPATLLRLAALATRTDSIDLLTSVYILPFHHPLETAEKIAVLDQISGGRVTAGFGLGYVPEEFDAFDVPMDERAGRLVEGCQLISQYLTADEPLTFDGDIFSTTDWETTPDPVQEPRPPILIGGWGDLALKRSLRLGDGWIAGLTADTAALADRRDRLVELAGEYGQDPDDIHIPVMRETIVAETREEALDIGKTYLHDVYKETYGSEDWSHPLLDVEKVKDFERLAEDRFLVGSPVDIVEQVESLRDRAGVTEVGCRFHFPGMPHDRIVREIELFGDEIIPEFD